MSQTITPDITADETAEIKAAIERMFVEMDGMNERMRRDGEEIEQSRLRTSARLEQVKAMLN